MCEWGDTVLLEVTVPAALSSTGRKKRKIVAIDRCIYPLVKALNNGGIATVASCCGHNNRPGNIVLADGRELVICPDYETARKVDKAFGDIRGEGKK